MKKTLLAIVAIAALAFGYWTISPLFIDKTVNEKLEDTMPPAALTNEPVAATTVTTTEPPKTATETSTKRPSQSAPATPAAPPSPIIIAQGSFVGLQDHNAEGRASLIAVGEKNYVRFEDDFTITNGPDLFVYLGKDGSYDPKARLAALKGNIGAQNYEIPASLSVKDYNEVWVWCRAFSVAFGKAALQ